MLANMRPISRAAPDGRASALAASPPRVLRDAPRLRRDAPQDEDKPMMALRKNLILRRREAPSRRTHTADPAQTAARHARYQSRICSPVQNTTSGWRWIWARAPRKYLRRCGAPMM